MFNTDIDGVPVLVFTDNESFTQTVEIMRCSEAFGAKVEINTYSEGYAHMCVSNGEGMPDLNFMYLDGATEEEYNDWMESDSYTKCLEEIRKLKGGVH